MYPRLFLRLDFECRLCKVPTCDKPPEVAIPPGQKKIHEWVVFESENLHAQHCKRCRPYKPCQDIQLSTEIVTKLTIFSYCYKIISADGKHDYPLRINQSPSCAEEFLRQLKTDMTTLWASLRINHPITITPEQQRLFELQDRCALCQVKFHDLPKSAKHRDHDHLKVCLRFEVASSLLLAS